MRKYRTRRGTRRLALLAGVLVALIGLGLGLYSLLGEGPVASASGDEGGGIEAPGSEEMTLTIPAMERVQGVPVYTGHIMDTATLEKGAMHVEGTGWPWQEEANVYIAGHRLGYEGTGSYLIFYDLDVLQSGDEVILTDANGTTYTYEVFDKFVVDPSAVHVTQPIPGKNIVSLQTCTLPDYSQRLIVQAELKGTS